MPQAFLRRPGTSPPLPSAPEAHPFISIIPQGGPQSQKRQRFPRCSSSAMTKGCGGPRPSAGLLGFWE